MTRLTAHPAHAIAVCFVSYFSGLIAALPFQQLLIVTICHQIDRVQTFTITDDEYERCARRTDVNSEMASLVLNLNLAEQIPSIIVTIFAGYFIDKVGRRSALIISHVALLISSIVYMIAAVRQIPTSVFIVLYVLLGCSGSTMLTDLSVASYISISTNTVTRTQYFMIQSCAMALSLCLGPLVGGLLARLMGFYAVFALMFTLVAFLLIYLIFLFPDIPLAKEEEEEAPKSLTTIFVDSVSSTMSTIKLLFSYKASFGILVLLTIFVISGSASNLMFVLYPSKTFGWSSLELGSFISFVSFLRIGLLTLGLPIIQRILTSGNRNKLSSEINLIQFSVLMAAIGEFCFGISYTSTEFWLAALPVSLSAFAAPSLRSILSTLVPASYQGRLFGSVQLFGSITGLGAMFVTNKIYLATVEVAPQALFFVMGGLYVLASVVCALFLRRNTVEAMRVASGTSEETSEEVLDSSNRATEETPLLA
ncbi:major facilitator superfamily domain-containing protein [Obelidium mucronatum]|nr:major facilitator superfamily domain-containing protein [Obelidium mucronatum]